MRKLFWVSATIVGLLTAGLLAYTSHPKPVSIQLPATKTALGANITLESAKRTPAGEIELNFTDVPDGSGLAPVEFGETRFNGIRVDYTTLSNSSNQGKSTYKGVFQAPRNSITNISQRINLLSPKRYAQFKFENIGFSTKPITQSIGGAKVTLRCVYVDSIVNTRSWGTLVTCGMSTSDTGDAICMELDASYPSGFTRDVDVNMTDANGHKYNVYTILIDPKRTTVHSVVPGIPQPNLCERMVGVINRDRAYNMRLNRRSLPAQSLKPYHVACLYVFKASKPLPKSFTFKLTGLFAPDKTETATVEFKNVPVR